MIDRMTEMGYPRYESARALSAANYDVELAVNFLIEGIPEPRVHVNNDLEQPRVIYRQLRRLPNGYEVSISSYNNNPMIINNNINNNRNNNTIRNNDPELNNNRNNNIPRGNVNVTDSLFSLNPTVVMNNRRQISNNQRNINQDNVFPIPLGFGTRGFFDLSFFTRDSPNIMTPAFYDFDFVQNIIEQ